MGNIFNSSTICWYHALFAVGLLGGVKCHETCTSYVEYAYMLEGALAKILTQAMLTWGRFAAWAFDEASIIKKLCKWLIKSCGECPFVCYLVIGMMDSLPWSSGGKDYSLEGARNISAHFAWAVCILGRIPWVQIWVACGTCRSLSKGHEIFIMKLVIHIMGIFTFTLTQQKMPGTPLLWYRWHELHISKLLYFTSSTYYV